MTGLLHQLIYTPLSGEAVLELDSGDAVTRSARVCVTFDPKTLRFSLALQDSDELVRVMAQGRRREGQLLSLALCQVQLDEPNSGVVLGVDRLSVRLAGSIMAWPESIGLFPSDYEASERPPSERALVLRPSGRNVVFHGATALSWPFSCQLVYGDACEGLGMPDSFTHEHLAEPVLFAQPLMGAELVCMFSGEDFEDKANRLHAALSLAHGRDLRQILSVQMDEVCFYGCSKEAAMNDLPLVSEAGPRQGMQLLLQLLHGFMSLDSDAFEHARRALRFFLLGKQAAVVELGFLQAMVCVEAMDEAHVLNELCTAKVLGVSPDVAFLFNGMRNKLVHGRGGYRQAFNKFLLEDLKQRQLATDLGDCVIEQPTALDFGRLWLRLCERLDAFWCAYLGVPDELVGQRDSPIPLMPAVDLKGLDVLAQEYQRSREEASGESKQLQYFRKGYATKDKKIKKLEEQVRKQGLRIQELTSQARK